MALLLLLLAGCTQLGLAPPANLAPGAVRIQVNRQPGGGVLATVPVTIGGAGPYQFALDTGASRSAIDGGLVRKLGLPVLGRDAGSVVGIFSSGRVDLVRVREWRVGSIALPPAVVMGLPLPEAAGAPVFGLPGFRGLLGSDVLSRFGQVTIDYRGRQLVLGRPAAVGRGRSYAAAALAVGVPVDYRRARGTSWRRRAPPGRKRR